MGVRAEVASAGGTMLSPLSLGRANPILFSKIVLYPRFGGRVYEQLSYVSQYKVSVASQCLSCVLPPACYQG